MTPDMTMETRALIRKVVLSLACLAAISPPAPVAGFATVFDASESVCTLGPCHYNWVDDADNSSLGTGQIISFTFRGVGVKFVHLTITDSLGRTASVERDVMVNPNTPPPPPPQAPPTPLPTIRAPPDLHRDRDLRATGSAGNG